MAAVVEHIDRMEIHGYHGIHLQLVSRCVQGNGDEMIVAVTERTPGHRERARAVPRVRAGIVGIADESIRNIAPAGPSPVKMATAGGVVLMMKLVEVTPDCAWELLPALSRAEALT